MPVTLRPLVAADIPAYVDVFFAAFGPHPRMPMLWPHGITADVRAFKATGLARDLASDANSRYVAAVDDATGALVAGAEWTFALDPAANAAAAPTAPDLAPPDNWPVDGNWAMRRFFVRNLEAMRKEDLGGQGYLMLDILVVDPKMQGRGIGAKLLEWGVKQADELGVATCLESTPDGLALYKKLGFTERKVVKADMRDFGWDQPYDDDAASRTWMIRDAHPRQ